MKPATALTALVAGLLLSQALADTVTPAVRTEINRLSQQYTGRTCRADYDLDTETYRRPLTAMQVKAKRTELYNEWKTDLAEDAREDGFTYTLQYRNDRIWYVKHDVRSGKREFGLVMLSATGHRELSCDQ